MRLWPDTLVGRTVVVLLAGVVLSNVVGLGFFVADRLDVVHDRGEQLAGRVAAAAGLMERVPPRDRRRVLRHLGGPLLRMDWAPRPWATDNGGDWRTGFVRRAVLDELEPQYAERLRIAIVEAGPPEPRRAVRDEDEDREAEGDWRVFRRPPHDHHEPGRRWWASRSGSALLGSLQLGDGSWLNFAAPSATFRPFWGRPAFPLALVTTVLVLAVSGWAVWRATRPLADLAQAAERFGTDVDAPPVSESGPREVRRAAESFNEMQWRLQRMVRDRTQMLAAISHDLRTPITRMKLRAEFVEDAEQQRKMLGDLDEMEAMIGAVLAFARDDATREPHKPLDLAALLQGVCDDASDAGGEATYEGPDHMRLDGRPLALKRAFANLVDNAVKYGGGAHVSLAEGDHSVTVTVDDDGPGLDAADLERVFDPFVRVEGSRSRETGGTGLGLAVVRAAVRAHGGEVTLANRAEGGLRAAVLLPRTCGGES